jgi:hypothetical protein
MKINKLNTTAYSSSILIIFWTVLLITLPINANASVSPTRIKIEAKPRDKVKFNIVVKNKNDTLRDYKVSYSYYDQDSDGFQKEIKLEDKSQEGSWDWIVLDSSETFKIDGKQSLPIEGTVKIPSRNSYGFHNILITVTELTPSKKTGVTLNYASGSLIELTVSGSKKRPKTALLNPMIKIDKESGLSMIHLDFENKSAYKGRLFLEAHLRHNRRLIAKIPLLNDQSRKSDMTYSSVFPNNLVNVSGTIEKPTTPGDYEIRFVGKFNGIRLQGFNHKLSIDKSGESVVDDKPTETANNRLKKES